MPTPYGRRDASSGGGGGANGAAGRGGGRAGLASRPALLLARWVSLKVFVSTQGSEGGGRHGGGATDRGGAGAGAGGGIHWGAAGGIGLALGALLPGGDTVAFEEGATLRSRDRRTRSDTSSLGAGATGGRNGFDTVGNVSGGGGGGARLKEATGRARKAFKSFNAPKAVARADGSHASLTSEEVLELIFGES